MLEFQHAFGWICAVHGAPYLHTNECWCMMGVRKTKQNRTEKTLSIFGRVR